MLKKYLILYGVMIPLLLLLIAALYYRGGVQPNKNSIGYGSINNCQSNHLIEKADNTPNNCFPVLDYLQDVTLMRQIRFIPF